MLPSMLYSICGYGVSTLPVKKNMNTKQCLMVFEMKVEKHLDIVSK